MGLPVRAGRPAAAHETLLEAKGLASGEMVQRIAVAEASWLMSQGEYFRAVEKIHGVDTDDDETRAYALSVRGVCEAFLGNVERGTATLEDARTAAHRSGSIRELTRAVGNLTFVLGSSGQHERSARIGKEALTRLGVQGLAPTFSAVIRYNLATSLLALGRWHELDALEVPDAVPGNKAARILLCKSVVEDDPAVDTVIGSFRVPCRTASKEQPVSGAGAFYEVSYVVTQLP
ncbi:hypothetical protein C8D87_104148 [Lentzea atacamensis]|uniref:Tetratricopeptide repeat protein n=1 Tax=Lentzea atacamensis TaxID=531938 RepID=A0ABX9E7E5_9PSEU|nr:hypothetical protein [Lentzea atacamensis]RAS65600.1 hypothetical protein C8D87_104148 [Lentzea atacamensis]